MAIYCPDNWNLVKVTNPEHGEYLKIYSGNYGGYVGSDTWKLSSAIKSIRVLADHYEILCESGSTYKVGDHTHMSSYMMSIWNSWKTQLPEGTTMEIVEIKDYLEKYK